MDLIKNSIYKKSYLVDADLKLEDELEVANLKFLKSNFKKVCTGQKSLIGKQKIVNRTKKYYDSLELKGQQEFLLFNNQNNNFDKIKNYILSIGKKDDKQWFTEAFKDEDFLFDFKKLIICVMYDLKMKLETLGIKCFVNDYAASYVNLVFESKKDSLSIVCEAVGSVLKKHNLNELTKEEFKSVIVPEIIEKIDELYEEKHKQLHDNMIQKLKLKGGDTNG
jgi:hypothetical protein